MKLENDPMEQILVDSYPNRLGKGQSGDDARFLYLDLMKRCLTDSIYINDPLSRFVFYTEKPGAPLWKRTIVSALARVLAGKKIRMVEPYSQGSAEELSLARKVGTD